MESNTFSGIKMAYHILGHKSAVYCVLFDKSGKFIFTGADDKLVKIWSATDGRLLTTLRGSPEKSAEITDLSMNYENTLLVASSCGVIRVWCLRTGALVSVLSQNPDSDAGNVTSILFCPLPTSFHSIRYLASTFAIGSSAFWPYSEEPGQTIPFRTDPTDFVEWKRPNRHPTLCSSFSPGGMFMATGSADFYVRVYYMLGLDGPDRILEDKVLTYHVDSISWSHRGLRFISDSKDGTAVIWTFEQQQWRHTRIYCSGPNPSDPPRHLAAASEQNPSVTTVGWNADDSLVLTATSDNLIKVWNPINGRLIRILRGHRGEAYVLETHPTNPRIVCTAGHDANIFIWTLEQ